ncbi:hypothetical protein RUM43_009791 [Polyplax serrata]|uniref:Uncharacterized protein n=1 Tax=Polyplax serrata TaxID=468196 RepID=A0AAN8P2W0_POLSC
MMLGGSLREYLSLLILAVNLPGFGAFFDEEKKPSYYEAAVGEAVIFNCHIEFPHDVPIPYILNWNKEVNNTKTDEPIHFNSICIRGSPFYAIIAYCYSALELSFAAKTAKLENLTHGQTIFSSYESTNSANDPYKGRIKLLHSDPDYGKASINLTNIRETDGGWYECQVLYPNRSPITHHNGTWFHLKVEAGNVIAIPPINQTTVEGEAARFPCLTKENSSTVVWKKDGVRLSNRNHNFPVRYTLNSEGTLTISPTVMDDLGEFTCEATNSQGEQQSASAFLNVQYKAKVIQAPHEIYLPYGRSAVIDCHFRSNPPLMKLRWEKDGFLFDPYNVQGVVYRSNGSLFFEEVKEEHGGSYTCTPYNELGTEGSSPKMTVIVMKEPVFTVIPQILYIRRRGETIHIPCDAIEEHGIHRPNITWLKNGKPLQTTGNLTLLNLREEDRGIYQCIASNAVNSIFAETELMIENTAPRAPYDVELDPADTSITVKWKSGLTKPKLEFSVWHRKVESETWKFLPVLPDGTKKLTISGLLPGTEYEIMVLSKDAYGEGMFSKTVKARTTGETVFLGYQDQLQMNFNDDLSKDNGQVIGSPQNLNVQVTDEGCMITWDPPNHGIEDLEHYQIQWVENESLISAITNERFYLVKDSAKGQTYRFQVSAVTRNKDQSEDSIFVIHVPVDRKIKAVTVGIILGTILLVIAIVLSWFIHRSFVNKT